MPRRSVRNLLRQFRNLGVDVAGKGETVSDEVQLVYKLDDLTPARADPTVGYLGVGQVIGGVVNRFGLMELKVNNPGGIAIDAVHMGTGQSIDISGAMWTAQAPVSLNNITILTPEFVQGTALIGFQTTVRSGTISQADTPGGNNVGVYWFASPVGPQTDTFAGVFIEGPSNGVTQFLFLEFANKSDPAVIGVRWRELSPADNMP